ncbi:MAG: right-handed parallel beta-helix repeat-containing protein [Oscillospiraceae bacterium]|nr:right-handed parallel beta-helix repeat-containing protein [Oscillospiraceae bacterium]
MAIYVSPEGSDTNTGAADSPLLTLAGAIEKSRTAGGAGKEIYLSGGEYQNTNAVLDERDCGLVIQAMDNETAMLRGGVFADGWQNIGGDLYVLELPPGITGDILMLEINGRFCTRSKFPQNGYIEHATECPLHWTSTLGGGWNIKPTHAQLTEMVYDPGVLPENFNWDNAEITVFHRWDESLVRVISHEPEKNLLKLDPECGHPVGGFGVKRYIVWNTEHGMEPGCWRIDKSAKKLYYRALPGEDMRFAETYIPVHSNIIKIDGEVKNLKIKNLTFMTSAAPMMPGGFGAAHITGAIDSSYGLRDCSFTGLTFKNISGWGISLWGKNGVNKNVCVKNCRIENSGAGAVLLADAGVGMKMFTAKKDGCIISENSIEKIGLIYFSGIGIYATCCDITGNNLNDLPYTGIAYVGGNGGRILHNRVSNAVNVLNDGAGIYAALCGEGVMSGNILENIVECKEYFSQRHALYFDEGCYGWTAEGNITINCYDAMMNHMADKGNVLKNNTFVFYGGEDLIITFARCQNYRLENNTFHSAGSVTFAGNKGAVSVFKNNNIYSMSEDIRQIYIDSDYSRSQPEAFDGENIFK